MSYKTKHLITKALLVALAFSEHSSADSVNDSTQDSGCTSWIINNEDTKLGFGNGSMCVELSEKRIKDMVRIEDTSIKKPFGGENSLPNEIINKGVKKPVKWVGDRLGIK